MVEHFMDMMAGSLGLKEPWYIESAKYNPETKQVDIYVGVREDAAIPVRPAEARRHAMATSRRSASGDMATACSSRHTFTARGRR